MTNIFTLAKPKTDFLAKKRGVNSPKISQKLNQLGFGSNFQGKLKPINEQSWWQNSLPHLYQNPIFWHKKRGGVKLPKSAKNSTNSDLAQIFRVSWNQSMIRVGNKKVFLPFLPYLRQNLIFCKTNGVENLQNQQKTQPTPI